MAKPLAAKPLEASAKSDIIEALFRSRWDRKPGKLSNAVVKFSDIQAGIRALNKKKGRTVLSDANPANFFKDFIRNKRRANLNWPPSVLQAGYTGRQLTGKNRCFEFVPLPEGQKVPFPTDSIPAPTEETRRIEVQTVNLALASRKLGRSDEAWLIQVLVRLRVIETHLALVASSNIIQLEHLQNNIKLSRAEIDAMFLGIEQTQDGSKEVLVSLEAKGLYDDILEGQILQQVKSIFGTVEHDAIVPMAAKVIAPSEVYVVEFGRISRDAAETQQNLEILSTAVYVLKPPVHGIGAKSRQSRKSKT